MEIEVKPSGMRLTKEGDCLMFKTEYFPDGSAIVATEQGILLFMSVAKYEIKSRLPKI